MMNVINAGKQIEKIVNAVFPWSCAPRLAA
jgi:hypothetical protein